MLQISYKMLQIWISCIAFLISSLLRIEAEIILDPDCGSPLGMQNGAIKDEDIKDTGHSHGTWYAYKARLNGNAAWCIPSCRCSGDGSFRKEFVIEINLKESTKITAIAFQGSPATMGTSITYGKEVQVAYLNSGKWNYHNQKDIGRTLMTNNLGKGEIEYYVLDPPIEGTAVRILMKFDGNPHCLRTELYGCRGEAAQTTKEYKICSKTSNPLMLKQNLDDKQYFKESHSHIHTFRDQYGGKSLLFELPFAWCVQGNSSSKGSYAWTSINLRKRYLLFEVQVNGYITTIGQSESYQYLAESFTLHYSFDEFNWSPYYGGKEMKSMKYLYGSQKLTSPFAAKFVKISIKLREGLNCIKLQLYGCDAKLYMPRIHSYDMTQGTSFNGINYKDSITNKDGVVTNSGRCLMNYQPVTNPVTNPNCWIAWSKVETPDPYIKLLLTREAILTGVSIVSYVNKTAQMNPFGNLAVFSSTSRLIEPQLIGYGCPPNGVYDKDMEIVTYTIALDSVVCSVLKLEFNLKGNWFFVRNVKVLQDEVKEGATLSSNPIECNAPGGKNSTKPLNVVMIICILLTVILIALLILLIFRYQRGLRHFCEKKTSGNGHRSYKGSKIDEDDQLMKHLTPNTAYDDNGRMTSSTYNPSKRLPSHQSSQGTSDFEQIYAAPSVEFDGYDRRGSNTSFTNTNYLLVGNDLNRTTSNASEYAEPEKTDDFYEDPHSLKAEYADPYSQPEPIYGGSVIYSATYENPYGAVMASSLYADPKRVVSSKSSNVKVFPRDKLQFKEKIGVGQFGEVHICEASGLDEIYSSIGHYISGGRPDTGLVAVKVLRAEMHDMKETEFIKEVNVMDRLKHENVVRLLGVCHDEPKLMVVEYMENGDLNMFLQGHIPYQGPQNVRVSQIPSNVLLLDTLLYMSTQIAAGMEYLHSEGFVHRDLATRNCLVGPAYQVKIADFGMSRHLYSKQYYRIEGKAVLPIRWMAPECLYYGTFSPKTDVWSFGVTLWEILTFAGKAPYHERTDEQVIENACQVVLEERMHYPIMTKPDYCPGEIYTIMAKCWRKNPDSRPTMKDIYNFFKDNVESSEEIV